MKEILVTGGAGYIGSHMVRRLLQNGYLPIVIDNLTYGHREAIPKPVPFYKGDIGNTKILQKIFQKHSIEAVMHFSAYAYVGESVIQPRKYYENNVIRTITLLNTMLDNSINKFIFSSTCATFGEVNTSKISEEHPQNPINPYGNTKLVIEKLLKDYDIAYNLKSIILRYFNAAGADDSAEIGESHDPETHLIPLALKAALDDNFELKVFGKDYPTPDGTCIRDYIHVNDLADAHLKALEYLFREERSDHFNLGTEQGASVQEIIDLCQKISGRKVKYRITNRRPGDPAVLIGDSTKAKQILGWQAKYSLEKIIETAWNWEKSKKY